MFVFSGLGYIGGLGLGIFFKKPFLSMRSVGAGFGAGYSFANNKHNFNSWKTDKPLIWKYKI